MLGGDPHELLTVRVAAVYFVKTTRWRVAGPADNGSTGENIVYERSRSGAVKQAGARLSFQTNSHEPSISWMAEEIKPIHDRDRVGERGSTKRMNYGG